MCAVFGCGIVLGVFGGVSIVHFVVFISILLLNCSCVQVAYAMANITLFLNFLLLLILKVLLTKLALRLNHH